MASHWIIRALEKKDREAAREVFFHGLNNQGDPLPERSILDQPILQPYLVDFPKPGDIAFIAADASTDETAGFVHCGFHTANFCGVGFYEAGVPELSIAVMPGFRGKGCGTELMSAALQETDSRELNVSLNCHPKNPAHRLYERLGFAVIATRPIGDLMLRKAGASAGQ